MFSPKVVIDENQILVREDVHVTAKSINWKDIKEITYKSFALGFLLHDNSVRSVMLRTNAETSVEIKRTLREVAERKFVNVVGG